MSRAVAVSATYRFARIPEWVLGHSELNATDVRVFGVLDRFDGKECIPSLGAIGERSGGISVETVRRSIRALERVGAVAVEARHESGRRTSNRYQLAGDTPLTESSDTRGRPLVSVGDDPLVFVGDDPLVFVGGIDDPEQEDLEQEELLVTPPGVTSETRTSKRAAARPRDELFETLASECYGTWKRLTGDQRSRLNAALKQLREIQADPDELRRACGRYRRVFPGVVLTPQAITGNWGLIAPPARAPSEPDPFLPPAGELTPI